MTAADPNRRVRYRRRWRWWAGTGALIVAAAIAVVLVQGWSRDRGSRPETMVVGDSVTALAAQDLNGIYGPDRLQIVARWGFRTDQLLPLLREGEGRAGRRRVALLVGYNDVFERTVDTAALPEMIKETSRFRCAVWMTLPSRSGGDAPPKTAYDRELVRRWNARLTTEADRYQNVHIARDWERLIDQSTGTRLIEDRGVHPEPPGRLKLAAIYRRALDRACGA